MGGVGGVASKNALPQKQEVQPPWEALFMSCFEQNEKFQRQRGSFIRKTVQTEQVQLRAASPSRPEPFCPSPGFSTSTTVDSATASTTTTAWRRHGPRWSLLLFPHYRQRTDPTNPNLCFFTEEENINSMKKKNSKKNDRLCVRDQTKWFKSSCASATKNKTTQFIQSVNFVLHFGWKIPIMRNERGETRIGYIYIIASIKVRK